MPAVNPARARFLDSAALAAGIPWPTLLAALVLALGTAAFYSEHLFGDAVIPYDSKDAFYPQSVWVAGEYRSGSIPLWNPYVFSGYPAFADPQHLLYSPAVLLFLIPETLTQQYFDAVAFLHIFATGFLVYLLSREFGLSWLASLIAGLVGMFGGPMAAKAQITPVLLVMPYFPLTLLLFKRALDRRSLTWAWLAGLAAGVLAVSGLHVSLLMFYALALFTAVWVATAERPRPALKHGALALLVLTIVAAGLAAVQLIPTIEFAGLSNREQFLSQDARSYSLWPRTLVTLAFGNFFGAASPLDEYWGRGDSTEAYLYLGAAPLLLASLGAVVAVARRRLQHLFPLLLAFLAVIYSFGTYTPVYEALVEILPGLSFFRRPVDAMYLTNLALALLAGIGLDALFRARRHILPFVLGSFFAVWAAALLAYIDLRETRFLVDLAPEHVDHAAGAMESFLLFSALALGTIALALAAPVRVAAVAAAILVGLVLADLVATSSGIYSNTRSGATYSFSAEDIYGDEQLFRFLKAGLAPGDGQIYRVEPVYAGPTWANGPIAWGIHSTAGYNPLRFERYETFADPYKLQEPRAFRGLTPSYSSPLFNLLAVRYLITSTDPAAIDPHASPAQFREVLPSTWKVYENLRVMPRAFIAYHALVVPEPERLTSALTSPGFDPRRTVLLERLPDTLDEGSNEEITFPASVGEARITDYQPTHVRISTDSASPGFLFLADLDYPGWKVYVDGERTDLLRADYAFRAVYIDGGQHRVEFVFRPASFKAGAAISLVTVAVSSAFAGFLAYRRLTASADAGRAARR